MCSTLRVYSRYRNLLTGVYQWNEIRPYVIRKHFKKFSIMLHKPVADPEVLKSGNLKSQQGSQGQTAPEQFDGGDYDEERNEEYEREAESRAKRIRRIKKVMSSTLFLSVLGYVGYSRRNQRAQVASNIQNAKFVKDDGLFKGSEKAFCEYKRSPTDESMVVLPFSIIKDGTIKRIWDFKMRDDDIIVASFPKCGTTWVQEIVYCINNDLNFKEAGKQVLEHRFPFLEYPFPGISAVDKMPSPRMIKTHLPFDFLPSDSGKAKIIYVTRNPKDAVVSYYHFSRMFTMSNFVGTFQDFVRKFKSNELPYSPFFGHVESYVRRKDDHNMLIISYEELSNDTDGVIKRIAHFMGKQLTEEDVQKLVEHTSFEKMKNNDSVNYEHWNELGLRNKGEANFLRKGQIGDWKNFFTKEENSKFDEWISVNNKSRFPYVFES